jgi:hypothetical protein
MKKWVAVLGLSGAVWMIFVLHSRSFFLATVSNYPGVFAARWVTYRGIGPSPATIWLFNIWLELTSAIEWIAVGLVARAIAHIFR